MTETLYVPCKVLSVDLTVGPTGGLSPLERLTLEAVHAGVSDVFGLADLFFLGQRPTLDLLWDLWRRGYLTIELRTGHVSLSDDVAARASSGTLDELPGGEVSDRQERVLQELLSGHLLRWQRRPRLKPNSRVVPARSMDDGEFLIRRDELVGVLEQILPTSLARTEEGDVGRDLRVLHFNVRAQQADRSTEQVLIEVTVEPALDPVSGHLRLPIIDPHSLSGGARRDMQRTLERLAEAMPSQPWVRALRDKVVHEETTAEPDLLTVITRLDRDVTTAIALPEGAIEEHEVRRASGVAVVERLRRAQVGGVQFQVLSSIKEHLSALANLLQAAKRQVVLSVPTVDFDAITALEQPLRRLLANDVRLVIIWGDRHAAELPHSSANFIDDLILHTRGDLVLPGESSRTGTFFAVQDAERVLLSSASILGPAGRQADNSCGGVLLETRETDFTLVRELLAWSKRRCADSRAGVLIDTYDSLATGTASSQGLPVVPAAPVISEDSSISRTSLALWQQSWKAFSSQVVAEVRDLGWWAELVLDVEHRTQLWSLLRRESRYLVIISRRFDAVVMNAAFFAALEQKLQAGTRVFIGHSEQGRISSLSQVDAVAAGFARLESRYPQLLHRGPIASAIELIADDTALLLSSFGFLRDPGSDPGSASGWRRPSHVGVLLRHAAGAAIVGPLLRLWGVPERVISELADARASLPSYDTVIESNDELQVLLRALVQISSEADRSALLRDWFASRTSADRAWNELEMLRQIDFAHLDVAAACCIWARRMDSTPGQRDRWLAHLAKDRWGRQEFVEAALLVPHDHQGLSTAGVPPAWLAELAASYELRLPIGDSLVDASLRDALGAEEVNGVIALSTAVLLFDGVAKADDCLDIALGHDTVPAPLRAVGTAAREFFQATRSALPENEIRAFSDALGQRDQTDRLYVTLQASLKDAETVSFRFELGRETWENLFSPSGTLAPLKSAIERADRPGVQAFLETHGSQRRDSERLLDEETARTARKSAAWLGTDSRIMGGKRSLCVSRLFQLLSDARTWASTEALERSRIPPGISDAISALASAVQENRDGLELLGRDVSVSAPLVKALSHRLVFLAKWS